jgi:hypothetical protein
VCLLSGSRNVAKDVATGDGSRVFAEIRGGRKPAVTCGDAQPRILAYGLPLPYKQGVSSSSLLAPTIITPGQGHEIDRAVILKGLDVGV